MELFLFLLAVIFVAYLFSRRNTHQYDRRKPPVSEQAADRKEKDDFAGGSIGAFFLLEEIVDQGAVSRQEPQAQQGMVQMEQFEDDYLHDEFFE